LASTKSAELTILPTSATLSEAHSPLVQKVAFS
jgi:hypothetical protein